MKTLFFILFILVTFPAWSQCNELPGVRYEITTTQPDQIYRPDASSWKGGDTIVIMGTNYPGNIEFADLHGDACRKIVIIPNDTVYSALIRFKNDCTNFELSGGTGTERRIHTEIVAVENCKAFRMHNIRTTGGADNGFLVKTQPNYFDPTTWGGFVGAYEMDSIELDHNTSTNHSGETYYVGHTEPSGKWVSKDDGGSTDDTLIIPVRLKNVWIHDNSIVNTGWDGIQLSGAETGNKIYNNYVYNYGTHNAGSQQAGIILGGATQGDVYNNTVIKGTGNGMEIFGFGTINVYNNTLDSCGYDGVTYELGHTGQHSFFSNDYITESNPEQLINFYNNTIKNPPTRGAMKISWDNDNSLASTVEDNVFCIPGAAENWQDQYILTYVPGTTKLNNVLYCAPVPSPCNGCLIFNNIILINAN